MADKATPANVATKAPVKKTATKAVEKKSLAQKLFEITCEVGNIKPDADGHNYKYASPAVVNSTFFPLFKEHKILLTTEVVNVEHDVIRLVAGTSIPAPKGAAVASQSTTEKYSTKVLYKTQLIFQFEDVESGEIRRVPFSGTGENGSEQGYGSSLTYARRYFLLSYFGISTSKDDPDYLKSQGKEDAPVIKLKKMSKAVHDSLLKGIESNNFALVEAHLAKYEEGGYKLKVENRLATAKKNK